MSLPHIEEWTAIHEEFQSDESAASEETTVSIRCQESRQEKSLSESTPVLGRIPPQGGPILGDKRDRHCCRKVFSFDSKRDQLAQTLWSFSADEGGGDRGEGSEDCENPTAEKPTSRYGTKVLPNLQKRGRRVLDQ